MRLATIFVGLMGCLAYTSYSYAESNPASKLYEKLAVNCVQCHANPETGAPLMGDTEQWGDVIAKDKETVLRNIYLGKGGMPPLGYCSSCSTDDFLKLTKIMMGLPISSQPISSQPETVHRSWTSELANKGKENAR